ncbi:hypothetical protein [Oribacterium sp. FC2011]|uniref:hypothetical protein n=1 Tax=Oribacterium sp. FC2011 TaxID=1408311 RepID=UPI0004E19D8E|nr:hypothetical protein [Oribacterium sp. FC2011]
MAIRRDVLEINTTKKPNVLFLGNGMLKLSNNSTGWDDLLASISTLNNPENVKKVPYAMQPEALCGTDVEDIQRRVADNINTVSNIHPLLQELLSLPFDAILTTNYTYEIEEELSKKPFTPYARKKAFTALDGNTKVNHNTFVCNIITTPDGRTIPVFHIHGEKERKHSMVLSYYSYAKSLSLLTKYNKDLGNQLFECQQNKANHKCKCWLDYFLIGNIWSVGFGLDVSEFDVWWAIERKSREIADHGFFKAYFSGKNTDGNPQKVLLSAMRYECLFYSVRNKNYSAIYRKIIDDIKADLMST